MKRDYSHLDVAIVENARAGNGQPNWDLAVLRALQQAALGKDTTTALAIGREIRKLTPKTGRS